MSVLYLAISVDIDSEGRLIKTLYYTNYFKYPLSSVDVSKYSKIPSVQAYVLFISCFSQLIPR